jgi:hypothetical protein
MNITRVALAVDSTQARTATRELKNMGDAGVRAESTVGKLGKRLIALGAATLTIRGVVNQFQAVIREGETLQRNMLRTEQLVRSTGQAAGFTARQLHEQARELAAATLQSTEGVMAAQQIMLTFRTVTGETFTRATELAADLATVTGTNLNSAMTQLGKVLEDPIRNLGQLNRSGVSFTKTQTDMIKELVETNRQAEAQSMILDVLAGQYGGVARREAEGLAGAQDALRQAIQEARQAIFDSQDGSQLLIDFYTTATEAVKELEIVIASGEIDVYLQRLSFEFENLGRDIEFVANAANDVFREFAENIGEDSDTIGEFLAGAFRDFIPNVRAAIQLAAVYIADFVQRTVAYGKAIAHNLDPRNWFDGEGYGDILKAELMIADKALADSIDAIRAERDAHIASGKAILETREQIRAEFVRQREEFRATAKDVNILSKAESDGAKAAEELDTAQKDLNEQLEKLKRAADPAYAALQDIQEVYEQLGELLDAGLIDVDQFDAIAVALTDKMLPAVDEVKESVKGIGEGFDEAAGDAVKAMLIMQRGLDSESKHYKNLEDAIQATNVVRAVAAVLTQGTGDPYTAFSRMATMAAVVASFGVHLSGSAKIGGGGTPSGQLTQGTGTVLGDMEAKSESILNATEITADATSKLVGINQDMLAALRQLQAGITGASTLIARGGDPFNTNLSSMFIANPLGKIADGAYLHGDLLDKTLGSLGSVGGFLSDIGRLPFDIFGGIISGVGKLLGGSSKVKDEGIEIIGGTITEIIDDTMVRAYQKVKSKKYVWSSSKTRTYYADLPDEVARQFSLVFDSIAESVGSGAAALGIADSEIEAAMESFFIDTIRISLKGLSAEDQAKEIEAVFGTIFDNLTQAVIPWLVDFQMVGEGLGETLARVATNVQVVEEAMGRLGFQLDVSETATLRFLGLTFEYEKSSQRMAQETAALSAALIEATGGMDKFIDGMNSFIKNFASDEYQFELLTSDLSRSLERVGLTIPNTRDAMWELMQTLDATTESGQEQIAALLNVSDLADEYYKELEKKAEERYNLGIRYLEATGDAAGALAQRRQLEIDATDESNRALLQFIYGLEDAAVAAQKAAEAEEELLAERQKAVDAAADMLRRSFDAERERMQAEYDALVQHQDAMEAVLRRSFDAERERMQAEYDALVQHQDAMEAVLRRSFDAERERRQAEYDALVQHQDAMEGVLRRSFDAVRERMRTEYDALVQHQDAMEAVLRRSFDAERERRQAEYDALVQHQDAMEDVLRRSFDAQKQTLTESYQETLAGLNAQVERSKESVSILTGAMNALSSASQSFDEITRGAILDAIMGVRGIAGQVRAGNVSALEGLSDHTRILTSGNQELYATSEDYMRDQRKSALALSQLEDATNDQLSIEEKTLDNLERQIKQAEIYYDKQISKLDDQLNAVLGVEETTMSVADAIEAYEEAKAAVVDYQFDAQMQKLDDQLNAVLGIDETTMSVADAIEAYEEAKAAVVDYQFDAQMQKLDDQLNAVLGIDETTMSVADAIEAYEEAKAAVVDSQFSAQMEKLDDQLNAVLGVEETTMSVADAIKAYEEAKAAVVDSQFSAQMEKLDAQLNAILGVETAVLSMRQALTNYASAAKAASILPSLSAEQRYLQNNQDVAAAVEAGSFDSGLQHYALFGMDEGRTFANGGVHSGGVRMVGESGPEIEVTGGSRITSNKALMDALGANKELLNEIRQLKGYIRQTTKNTGETRDRLNRWNVEGLPEERAAI